MSLAGALLLVAGRPDPVWLCLLGAGTALLYLGANLFVRSAYLDALAEQLREGRLDLASVEAGLGAAEVGRLAELWAELLHQAPTPVSAIAELAPLLAARQTLVPLVEGLSHEDADVRLACVTALASTDTPSAENALLAALEDDDAAVRLTALRALGDEVGSGRLEQCLSDPDPRVCVAAALRLGARGAGVLQKMAASGDAAEALAALTQLPHQLRAHAESRLADRDPRVRAAALGRFAAWARSGDLSLERIEAFLSDESTVVRREAVRAADAILGNDACAPLSRALDDPVRSVRRTASEALARRGDLGVEAAEPLLRQGPWTADAALSVLGRVDSSRARDSLRYELRSRVTGAWENLLSLHALVDEADAHARLLRAAHADGLSRNVRMAFRALRHLEGAEIVASVDRVLRMGTARARGNALELLSNLGDRAASGRLALLLEAAPLEERMRSSGETAAAPKPRAVREHARHSSDRWDRIAVAESEHQSDGEGTMERLLALKQVPLFARLSLDQLESVNRAMRVEHFARGEVVVREGERGNRLYVVLEGEIEIWSSWGTDTAVQLNRLRAVSTFGEMAVLHEQTRTATAVVAEDALLASLDGDRMKELILRMPEISFVILGELVQRALRAEERLRRQNGSEAPSA
jgi:HEAT repeat protein